MKKDVSIIVDVHDILLEEIGQSKHIEFKKDIANIDDLELIKPISGKIDLINLGESILTEIHVVGSVKQLCARCAMEFDYKVDINYKQNFKDNPGDDEFPISSDSKIDVWPSIRQEILLNLPLQPLCNKDCKGISVKV